jgi:hypothetical protein
VEEIIEDAEVVTRVAALDISKATLMACVRVPHEDKPGRRTSLAGTMTAVIRSPGQAQILREAGYH